jgi:hypothetical protein
MNLKSVLNKNSPWAHTELEFDVLGVSRKLVKYVVHLSQKKFEKYLSFFTLPKLQLTSFWSQGILGVKAHSESIVAQLMQQLFVCSF